MGEFGAEGRAKPGGERPGEGEKEPLTTPKKRGAASGARGPGPPARPVGLELSPATAASGSGGTGTPMGFAKAAVQTEWLLGDGETGGFEGRMPYVALAKSL